MIKLPLILGLMIFLVLNLSAQEEKTSLNPSKVAEEGSTNESEAKDDKYVSDSISPEELKLNTGKYEKRLGVVFGTPGLLSLRGFLGYRESLCGLQMDLSDQVLFHNQRNGRLQYMTAHIQKAYELFDLINAFFFVGLGYYSGYLKSTMPKIYLPTADIGYGVQLLIKPSFSLVGELGASFPLHYESGFEATGLILKLAIEIPI